MKPYYLVTDLDGTLLRPNAVLSPFAKEVVHHALEQGIFISYATARSYKSSMDVVGDIDWRYPLILYNGALLFDPIKKELLEGAFLSPALTDEVIRLGQAFGLSPLWFALDERNEERVLHRPLQRTGDLQFVASRPNDSRFREVSELLYSDQHHTLILTFIGLKAELEPLMNAIRTKFQGEVHLHFMPDNYIADHYFLEVSHPQANKRDGLLMWAKHMGCSPKDIIVFGDNMNDIGMFEAAGTAMAVANAQPELRAIADDMVESNAQDGVAYFIQGLLKSK